MSSQPLPEFPPSLAETFPEHEPLHTGELSRSWLVQHDGAPVVLRHFHRVLETSDQEALLGELKSYTELDLAGLPKARGGGTSPDGAWAIFERVGGVSPRDTTCPASVLVVLQQAAQTLEALHRGGLIHGDVRTDNIRVTPEGRVVLLGPCLGADPRKFETDELPARTGFPQFLAPQLYFLKRATSADDWFAWGVVAWNLVEGGFPFSQADMDESARQQTLPRIKPERIEKKSPLGEAMLGTLAFVPQDRARTISKVGDLLADSLDPGRAETVHVAERRDLPERQTKSMKPESESPGPDAAKAASESPATEQESPFGLLAALGAFAVIVSLWAR